MLASLRLEPEQLDARNMLGVILARQGDKARAAVQWRDLLRNGPTTVQRARTWRFLTASSPFLQVRRRRHAVICRSPQAPSRIDDFVRKRFHADGTQPVMSVRPYARISSAFVDLVHTQ